ncbi:MAG: peptide/nickel transport system substrate-binding protein [Nocardioidaceae bacterium]|jgi:peptide/nickel transport system substrate-binding protein|nr:peptide/nickel transport system substrate-binding protein [Nocardioidaceae bacterium]
MRFKKPIVALSTAGLLALAACGGGSSGGNSASNGNSVNKDTLGNTGNGQDPTAKGPVTISGAQKGGMVTVLTTTGITTSIDPQDMYYTDTDALGTGLMFRSLTQYKYDPKSGQMILVPDLATDLGQHNADYTQWTFTIRSGVKWETGDPVTAQDVARGIIASMDAKAFPDGPGLYYSNPYFLGGDKYKGPYTENDPNGTKQQAVSVSGNKVIVKMSQPFPDFPYYGTFPAMGPRPAAADSDPATYGQHPLATGPYMIKSYTRSKSLVLQRNPNWDPATDPARTQYPDGYDVKAGVQYAQIDEILLADKGQGQTTMTYEDIQAQDYRKFQEQAQDRIVNGGSPCTYFLAPDYRKITDLKVRQALAWAYPYKDVILASGLIPNVTAIPATNIMPPGIPGRVEYNPLAGHQALQTDPAKAKQLLQESGNTGYEIRFLWRTDNEVNTKSKDVLVKALQAAGFKATPVATTEAAYTDERANPKTDINLRSVGWCSDWPSGSTWIPPNFQSTDIANVGLGTNFEAFSEPTIDAKIKQTMKAPVADQPKMWNDLEKEIQTKYFPVIPQYYTGIAQVHGSKIQGHNDDNTLGMPTYKNIWVSQ